MIISTFTGTSATSQKEATQQASEDFGEWYRQQRMARTDFQFSTTAFVDPRGIFVYIITVLDFRDEK